MIYERRHTREISEFGGLATVMPLFAGAFLFTAFASIGLPGLNGFVGEFFVLIGSYLSLPGYAIAAAFGVVLAAVYLLWAYQRMFTGAPPAAHRCPTPETRHPIQTPKRRSRYRVSGIGYRGSE